MLRLESHGRSQDLRCSYCLDGLPDQRVRACQGCGTVLHEACLGELSSCPTIGCRGVGLEALDPSRRADLLDQAEASLRRAQAEPGSGLLEAQRAYAEARERYRESDRIHFQTHGVGLSTTAPTRPRRDQSNPRSDRLELPVAWPLVAVLALVGIATSLHVSPGIATPQEAVVLACGITLLGLGAIKGASVLCKSYAEGSPYR